MANEELEALKLKRKIVKSSLTRFKTFVNAFKPETDEIENLKLRLEKALVFLDEFVAIGSSIFSIEDNEEQFILETETFETNFYATLGKAKHIINDNFPTSANNSSAGNQTIGSTESVHMPSSERAPFQNQVKLPTINIPVFSGAYDQWLHFRDTYKSLIHEHAILSKIEKFHYLRSALSGEAADQVQSLETTAVNYDIAWALLQERYENKILIIGSHLDAIFDTVPLQQESYVGLRQLHACVEKHLRSLKALELPVDKWDVIIIHIIISKLDPVTLRDWKGVKCEDTIPTLKEMLKFLNDRCQVLQSIKVKRENPKLSKGSTTRSARIRQTSKSLLTTNGENCIFCKEAHLIKSCPNLLKLAVPDRVREARSLRLCLNCLKRGHRTRDCRHDTSCSICNKRHNSMLHLETERVNNNTSIPETSASDIVVSCHSNESRRKILLATALIHIQDKQGKSHEIRALLDSASQSNFVTERLCNVLQLCLKPIHLNVSGIGSSLTKANKRVNINFHSRVNSFKATLSCLVLPQITSNIPEVTFDYKRLNIPDDLRLADPDFNQSAPIDLLIGASLFWDLLCEGQVRLGHGLPLMQKTQLGWIVSGPLNIPNPQEALLCHLSLNHRVDQQLQNFWEIEERFLNQSL